MIYTNCKLLRTTGDLFADEISIDLNFRAKSTEQPDSAALWYGTLISPLPKEVAALDQFKLQISETASGIIQIPEAPFQADQSVKFDGIANRPPLSNPPEIETATKICDECKSPFFAPASMMSGLCPECAHHLYGYRNCDHTFSQNTCCKCGWDGSTSDFIRQIKQDDTSDPD